MPFGLRRTVEAEKDGSPSCGDCKCVSRCRCRRGVQSRLHLIGPKTQFHIFPVEHRIRAGVHPLAEVDVSAAVGEGPVNGQVPMSENEIIGVYTLFNFAQTILEQPFVFFAQPAALRLRGGGSAFLGG